MPKKLTAWFRSSIQAKLTALFLISAFIPIALLAGSVTYSAHRVIVEKELEYATDKLETVNQSLDTVFTEMERTMAGILTSSPVMNALRARSPAVSLERFYQAREAEELLRSITPHMNEQVTYTIVGSGGDIYSSANSINRYESLEGELAWRIIENAWRTTLLERRLPNYSETPVITMGKSIKDQGEVIGILFADLDRAWVDEMFRVFEEGASVYIARVGEPFYTLPGSLPLEELAREVPLFAVDSGETVRYGGREYLCIRSVSADSGLQACALLPLEVVYRDSHNSRLRLMLIILLIVVQTSIFARLVAARFSSNIRALSGAVTRFADSGGARIIQLAAPSTDEIGQLTAGVGEMSRRIVAMVEQIKENEGQKRRLEIAALQSQINPHMLYNTLNTITYLARLQGVGNIEEVSAGFSQMMRILSKTTGDFLTIRQELDYIRSYIALKKYQLLCNLEVAYDIAPHIQHRAVLKLLLQPFVENALTHGFAEMTGPARLLVSIREEAPYLCVAITDNGRGMAEDTRRAILEGRRGSGGSFSSVGIGNTVERLRLQYAGDYYFNITSRAGGGTTVDIHFPSHTTGGKEGADD